MNHKFEVMSAVWPPDSFAMRYQVPLQGLFDLAGMSQDWTTNPDDLVERTQPWARGDHFSPQSPVELDESHRATAIEHLRAMGMVDAVVPPGGEYDQVIVLGGMMRANRLRTQFAVAQLARPEDPIWLAPGGQLHFWGGPRYKNEDKEGQITGELFKLAAIDSQHPWLQHQAALPESERIATETEQGRLGLHLALGDAAMQNMRAYLREDVSEGRRLWLPAISHYVFGSEDAPSDDSVVVLNGRAVPRDGLNGAPRHTTKSCAEEWLEDEELAPVRENARVLFVTSNPYVWRTTEDVRRVVAASKRSDIEIVGCGPATYDDAKMNLYFGEVARSLYLERQAMAA